MQALEKHATKKEFQESKVHPLNSLNFKTTHSQVRSLTWMSIFLISKVPPTNKTLFLLAKMDQQPPIQIKAIILLGSVPLRSRQKEYKYFGKESTEPKKSIPIQK